MIGLIPKKTILLFVISFIIIPCIVTVIMAAPQRIGNAKPGNCKECHGAEKVLPNGHTDTNSMVFKDCLICHPLDKKGSLRTKITGSHIHNLAGVTCDGCHDKKDKQESVEFERCLMCHEIDRIVAKTSKIKPTNPHTSPHYGKDLDCNLCHHQHAKSENYCNQCHDFKFVVP